MKRRLILPIVLGLVGMLMLTGCIYIPTFGITIGKVPNLSKKIGAADSDKPLRLTIIHRRDVEALIGRPSRRSRDPNEAVYQWHTRSGIYFLPLCFWNEAGYFNDDRIREFHLYYDQNDLLIGYEVTG